MNVFTDVDVGFGDFRWTNWDEKQGGLRLKESESIEFILTMSIISIFEDTASTDKHHDGKDLLVGAEEHLLSIRCPGCSRRDVGWRQ